MDEKILKEHIPLLKIIKVLILLALGMQLIVISQMYFFRADLFADPYQLFIRLFRGTVLTFVAGMFLVYPGVFVIKKLNRKLPWKRYPLKRFFIQFPFAVLGGLLITPVIILPATLFFGLESDFQTLLNNAYYLVILNLFLMLILEARIYFDENDKSILAAAHLQQELLMEASNRARVEAQMQIEEEKNKYAQKLIEQEKKLNQHLEEEIKKRGLITRQLNESRDQLNSILSNLAGAAYRCHFDEHYTMKYISEKIFDISGYHASEFIGNSSLSFASIIHPKDQEFCRKNIEEATLHKTHYEFEYRIMHKSGDIVWVNENGKAIYNVEGGVDFLDGIIVDITRRKQAEFAVSESERHYKEMMDFLPQPIYELDINGNILFNNRAGQKFFNLPDPDESEEKISALKFFVEEDIPRVIQNIKKSNENREANPNEYTVKKPDGSLCPVLIYGSPIVRNNKIVGRRGIIIDISERKKQEVKLLQAKEELERINNTLEQSVAERTKQLTEANTQLLKMQKENLQSQFEVLKQQVNPHFLFNSLNVLTSLIKIDPDLAESFTERLSKVYRYVLENKEKDVVSLSTELEFLNSYLFLLEIRFMKKLFIEINIDKAYYDYQILPIAIQLIIENAIKHNTFSKIQPLKIEIFVDDKQRLNIINNLNLRETKLVSTGVGLENINRRYALVCDQKPEFIKTNDQFIAKLPLLKSDKIETT
ncbi:MAG: PAS domain S-box protein [Bacteroidales bacterium]|nr:PAS domain S-box protein [Bacteroidales bacterium]